LVIGETIRNGAAFTNNQKPITKNQQMC